MDMETSLQQLLADERAAAALDAHQMAKLNEFLIDTQRIKAEQTQQYVSDRERRTARAYALREATEHHVRHALAHPPHHGAHGVPGYEPFPPMVIGSLDDDDPCATTPDAARPMRPLPLPTPWGDAHLRSPLTAAPTPSTPSDGGHRMSWRDHERPALPTPTLKTAVPAMPPTPYSASPVSALRSAGFGHGGPPADRLPMPPPPPPPLRARSLPHGAGSAAATSTPAMGAAPVAVPMPPAAAVDAHAAYLPADGFTGPPLPPSWPPHRMHHMHSVSPAVTATPPPPPPPPPPSHAAAPATSLPPSSSPAWFHDVPSYPAGSGPPPALPPPRCDYARASPLDGAYDMEHEYDRDRDWHRESGDRARAAWAPPHRVASAGAIVSASACHTDRRPGPPHVSTSSPVHPVRSEHASPRPPLRRAAHRSFDGRLGASDSHPPVAAAYGPASQSHSQSPASSRPPSMSTPATRCGVVYSSCPSVAWPSSMRHRHGQGSAPLPPPPPHHAVHYRYTPPPPSHAYAPEDGPGQAKRPRYHHVPEEHYGVAAAPRGPPMVLGQMIPLSTILTAHRDHADAADAAPGRVSQRSSPYGHGEYEYAAATPSTATASQAATPPLMPLPDVFHAYRFPGPQLPTGPPPTVPRPMATHPAHPGARHRFSRSGPPYGGYHAPQTSQVAGSILADGALRPRAGISPTLAGAGASTGHAMVSTSDGGYLLHHGGRLTRHDARAVSPLITLAASLPTTATAGTPATPTPGSTPIMTPTLTPTPTPAVAAGLPMAAAIAVGGGASSTSGTAPIIRRKRTLEVNVPCDICAHQSGTRIVLRDSRERLEAGVTVAMACARCCTLRESSGSEAAHAPAWERPEMSALTKIECEVCKRALGKIHVRHAVSRHAMASCEAMCAGCHQRFHFCTECGGGGKRTGKYRPVGLFSASRKTCTLSHLRVGDSALQFQVLTLRDVSPLLLDILARLYMDVFLNTYATSRFMCVDGAYIELEDIKAGLQQEWDEATIMLRWVVAQSSGGMGGADVARVKRYLDQKRRCGLLPSQRQDVAYASRPSAASAPAHGSASAFASASVATATSESDPTTLSPHDQHDVDEDAQTWRLVLAWIKDPPRKTAKSKRAAAAAAVAAVAAVKSSPSGADTGAAAATAATAAAAAAAAAQHFRLAPGAADRTVAALNVAMRCYVGFALVQVQPPTRALYVAQLVTAQSVQSHSTARAMLRHAVARLAIDAGPGADGGDGGASVASPRPPTASAAAAATTMIPYAQLSPATRACLTVSESDAPICVVWFAARRDELVMQAFAKKHGFLRMATFDAQLGDIAGCTNWMRRSVWIRDEDDEDGADDAASMLTPASRGNRDR
ncbi:hypothetical protein CAUPRSCDRAFT_11047, partial [Caulochytrium protostelioides]